MTQKIDFFGQLALISISLIFAYIGYSDSAKWLGFLITMLLIGAWQLFSIFVHLLVFLLTGIKKEFLLGMKWYGLGLAIIFFIGTVITLLFKDHNTISIIIFLSWLLAIYYLWICYQRAFPKKTNHIS